MSGNIRLSRNFFDDPAFKDEPFTQREAFLWLIMEASFKAREKRVGDFVVHLERGQLAASVRFMAEAWQWHRSRVSRYLEALKNRDMIETHIETGLTVITLCKYDVYQSEIKLGETGSKTKSRHERDTTETNENKDEIKDIDDDTREKFSDEKTDLEILTQISGKPFPSSADQLVLKAWKDGLGLSQSEIAKLMNDVMARRNDPRPPSSFKYFTPAMQEFAGEKNKLKLKPVETGGARFDSSSSWSDMADRDRLLDLAGQT